MFQEGRCAGEQQWRYEDASVERTREGVKHTIGRNAVAMDFYNTGRDEELVGCGGVRVEGMK